MAIAGLAAARYMLTSPLSWYLRLTPLKLGRTRLMTLGARILGAGPHVVSARDGRRFELCFPRDHGWEQLYFLKTFETGTTETLQRILRADDVTVDVGANIGWYTTLFAKVCPQGHCHAFEPLPSVFQELALNCRLNRAEGNVTLNTVGVGEQSGEGAIYAPSALPHGYASVSPRVAPGGAPIRCRITTLDQYVRERAIPRVDLIKVDVEGAELMVLKGADAVIRHPDAPMWLIEVNDRTSAALGYRPPALFEFLAARQQFRFFRIVQGWGELAPMRTLEDCAHADNVLCVPHARFDRLREFR